MWFRVQRPRSSRIACVQLALSRGDKICELLEGSYAGSRVLATRKQRVVNSEYSSSGAVTYMVKDLTYAIFQAARPTSTVPQLAAPRTAFTDITELGFGDTDIAVTRTTMESPGSRGALD